MYGYLCRKGFSGIEIAPTKIFSKKPYEHIDEAVDYALNLLNKYNLLISSMQSIWYGENGNIFNSSLDRENLLLYTFKAIDFASAINCKNIVFGNPKARNKGCADCDDAVEEFFCKIADYAVVNNTHIALEPNPVIYNTDFINYTYQAFNFCRKIKSNNLMVNVDLGTMIYNRESINLIKENISLVNHIHISEPYLAKIQKRDLHRGLKELEYDKFISIEMGYQENIKDIFETIDYVCEVFK